MKGLLLKDLYTMARTVKTYLLVIFIYVIAFGMIQKDITAAIAVSGIIVAMAPITAIAYDEQSKFDKLAGTMPVSAKQIVLSKYLLGFILCLASISVSSIMVCAVSLFSETESEQIAAMPATALLAIVMSVFYHSLLFPTVYKFGTTKGRIYTMLIMFVFALLIIVTPTVASTLLVAFSVTTDVGKYLILASPLLLIGMYAGSIALSVKIYKKKDF